MKYQKVIEKISKAGFAPSEYFAGFSDDVESLDFDVKDVNKWIKEQKEPVKNEDDKNELNNSPLDNSDETESKNNVQNPQNDKSENESDDGGANSGAGNRQNDNKSDNSQSNEDEKTVNVPRGTTKTQDFKSEIDEIIGKWKETPATKEEPKKQTKTRTTRKKANKKDMKLTGLMLLGFIDMFFPFVIQKLYALADKDANLVDLSRVQLDDKETKMLEPAADDVAEQLFYWLPSWAMLLIGIGVFMGTKFKTQLNIIKEQKNGK